MATILEKLREDLNFAGLRRMFYLVTPSETIFEKPEDVPDYFDSALGWFVTFMVVEVIVLALRGKLKQSYQLSDTVTSMSAGMFSQFTKTFDKVIIITVYTYIYSNWRVIDLPWDSTFAWITCFLVQDFLYYLGHRATHEVGFFWSFHQMHHSSEFYNYSTALRQGIFQGMLLLWFDCVQAFFIPTPIFIVHKALVVLYQFWIHTEAIGSLGVLEYVINTPSHHRVHHGRNRYCIDKNYGGTLIIWDRLLGTFEAERKEEPVAYGLVDNVKSFNQLYCQLFEFKVFGWDKPKSLEGFINKIKAVFYPPGWFPGTKVSWFIWFRMWDTEEGIPDVENPVQHYNPSISLSRTCYVFGQFFGLSEVYTYYIANVDTITRSETWMILAILVLSMQCIGAIMDKKSYDIPMELIRLSILFGIICLTNYLDPEKRQLYFWLILGSALFVHVDDTIEITKDKEA